MRNTLSAKWGLPIMAAATMAAYGFVAPQATPEFVKNSSVEIGTRVVRPDVVKSETESFNSLSTTAKVEVDARSGAARLISGSQLTRGALARPTKEALVNEALAFVQAHQDVFGVQTSDIELNDAATLIAKDVQFLKFRVKRGGIVVQDAGIDFRFKYGKLLQVNNQTFSEAQGDDRPSLEAGLDVVAERSVLGSSSVAQGERLRVVQDKKGYHLVKTRQFETVAQDGKRFLVQVDAASGKVFEIRPTTFELEGSVKGSVYPRWYRDAAEVRPYSRTNVVYGTNSSLTSDLDGNFAGAPDGSQPRLDGLDGTIVKTVPTTGTKIAATGGLVRNRWDVVYAKGNDAAELDKTMAQSMAHYHLNYIINHAKAVGVTTPWFDRQLTANVNLAQTCNAHWDGSTVNFYSGDTRCANTALISDVMYHEWGHGFDENTGGIDDGAFSEGFGDIMSLTITHSNQLGIGFRLPGGEPVRDLEPNKVYPTDMGEVHAEGLIIGGTFWDLYKYLKETRGEAEAGRLLDQYAYKVIYTATRYTDVYAALQVIDDDNGDLSDGTPNFCTINKAFAEHGLAQADEACSLASIDTFQIDDTEGGNGNGVIEPGENVKLTLTARNAASQAVDNLTGLLSVATNGVTVTDANLSWANVPARSSRPSDDGAAIQVSNNVACGTQIAATVKLAADTRTNVVNSVLSVGRLDGQAEVANAAGLPAAIHDNQTTTAMLSVNSAQWGADTTVNAARLKFDITHTYVGDLTVKLIAPDGTTKDIWQGSGATHDEHFDADVTAALKGLKGKGDWKLTVTDDAGQDEGTLDAAMLTLTPAKFVCE